MTKNGTAYGSATTRPTRSRRTTTAPTSSRWSSPTTRRRQHTATKTITVTNVAPTAAFNAPTSVNEGSNINISLTGVVDPGSGDTHEFRFSCDNGATWTDWGTTSTYACSTTDNGTRIVKGEVRDDDDGSNSYSASVTVNNVAPTLSTLSISGSGLACVGGNAVTIDFTFADPGADTFTGSIAWGDGSSIASFTSSPVSASHTYAAGTYVISVSVSDDDGGQDTDTGGVSLLYNVSGVLQPVNNTQAKQDPSVFKYGSTIPVKIQVTDCHGVPVSGLAPQISVKKIAGSTPPTGIDETISSTSGADSGTTMRWSESQYIYNLATKSLADSSATYQITITGSFAPVTAMFGTKAK